MSRGLKKHAVIGAGAWGSALASMLARNGRQTHLWGRDETTCNEITRNGLNGKYLPGIDLGSGIHATTDLGAVLEDAAFVLIVTPSQTMAEIASQIRPHFASGASIILCSKGIDLKTMQRPSQTVGNIVPDHEVFVLSGPSFASDVATGLPTAVTLAHADINRALECSESLAGHTFRIYASDDVPGVELAGALKNILAIAVGVTRGLNLGASAEAALTTRGFAEIGRLVMLLGGRQETLSGLAGIGDVVLSCSGPQSRNFRYGMAIGAGEGVEGLPLAEGAKTVFSAHELAVQNRIECPVIATTRALVAGEIDCKQAIGELLNRPLRTES